MHGAGPRPSDPDARSTTRTPACWYSDVREFVAVLVRLSGRPWSRLVAVTVVAALLGGMVHLGWTWRHPQAFTDAGGWGSGFREAEVGQTYYVGMTYPRDRDGGHVTLRSGRVDVVRGGEVAETALLLCTLDPNAHVGAIGAWR